MSWTHHENFRLVDFFQRGCVKKTGRTLMTDTVQINTLDEELEWEEWKGVCTASTPLFTLVRIFHSGGMP